MWYSALAALWYDRQLFGGYLLCNLHAGDPSKAPGEISGTIQSPPGNNSKLQDSSGENFPFGNYPPSNLSPGNPPPLCIRPHTPPPPPLPLSVSAHTPSVSAHTQPPPPLCIRPHTTPPPPPHTQARRHLYPPTHNPPPLCIRPHTTPPPPLHCNAAWCSAACASTGATKLGLGGNSTPPLPLSMPDL